MHRLDAELVGLRLDLPEARLTGLLIVGAGADDGLEASGGKRLDLVGLDLAGDGKVGVDGAVVHLVSFLAASCGRAAVAPPSSRLTIFVSCKARSTLLYC